MQDQKAKVGRMKQQMFQLNDVQATVAISRLMKSGKVKPNDVEQAIADERMDIERRLAILRGDDTPVPSRCRCSIATCDALTVARHGADRRPTAAWRSGRGSR